MGFARVENSAGFKKWDRFEAKTITLSSFKIQKRRILNILARSLRWPIGGTKIYDVVQQIEQPDDLLLDAFRIDGIDIGRAYNTAPDDWKPFTLADGSAALIPNWFNPVRLPDGNYETHLRAL